MKKTQTSSFGVGRRESHDSSPFYQRSLYGGFDTQPLTEQEIKSTEAVEPGDWANRVYCHTSEDMRHLPDNCIALAFTSPPYNVGKDYEGDINIQDYLALITRVGKEVYRVLQPSGRYVINIANLGRKPYIPLHSFFYQVHGEIGFLSMGEIIWRKARGARNNCAWGSWASAKAPRLRNIHEYLLVLAKQAYSRPDKGITGVSGEEFMESTLSIWEIPAESAKKVGHPAPFPLELAARVIKLFSYVGDVVLDPFMGAGTTCVAAAQNGRRYVGYEIEPAYCKLAEERIAREEKMNH
jgi:site-specific DNA-methyltransferase (adenine-specific)